MKQDELERRMLEAAREYHEPPEPPREEMWAAIREALPEPHGRARPLRLWPETRRRAARLVRRLPGWGPWAVGLAAAMMVVGFGLGRTVGPAPVERVSSAPPGAAAEAGASLPVRMAAADHLGEAEALLTLFRSTDHDEDRAATARWARELLATTRLMIDSRAGEDPELAQLLGDLELVLVQIASAASGPGGPELIEDGMQDRQLLAKLRSATPPVDLSL